jgi:hypothetical protein
MRRLFPVAALALFALVPSRADLPKPETFDETGFKPIFNGKDLTGWYVSADTGHSRKSGNKSGGRWAVEDGVMVGSQDIPGNGGIILTGKLYGDFEIALEMRNDDGPDSGLFLRSNEKGQCYQAMIDYHKAGNLMGVYGEGLPGGKPNVRNFSFINNVTEIKIDAYPPFPCPVAAADWKAFWNPNDWNELRARIEGNPPKLTTWVKGVKFMEYQDTEKRLPDAGQIGLQVHGGGDYTKQYVRYRNIRVKELKKK